MNVKPNIKGKEMTDVGKVTDIRWYEAMQEEHNINLIPEGYTYPGNISITYQKDLSSRIYLDEYPEQKELRDEWLEKVPFTYAKLLEMIKAIEV